MNMIRERFPQFHEIFLVYSIANFLSFSWALLVFFYYLPSWIKFLSIVDLIIAFCYESLVVLFDVLIIVSATILLAILLPTKIMRVKFVSVGGIFVASLFLWIVLLQIGFDALFRLQRSQIIFLSLAFLGTIVGSIYIVHRIPFVSKLVEEFSKRVSIFISLYVPWYVICFVVVVFRNVLLGI